MGGNATHELPITKRLPVTVGVPQGSIMGPVLFTLYVNNLFRVPNYCEPLGYVDDIKLLVEFPSSKLYHVATVNEDLKEISSWCCRNSLLINPDKTKLLYVGVPQPMRTLPAVLTKCDDVGNRNQACSCYKGPGCAYRLSS